MSAFSTTRMSSKGQIVIPEEIRSRLRLEPGAQFLVVGDGDVVILKTIPAPSMNEFDDLVAVARKQARRSGLRKRDVDSAVRKVREAK